MMRALLCSMLLLLAAGDAAAQFARADAPRAWSFPRDHGSHPEFATEWWYFTGSLQDVADRRFGYELTFFRVALSERVLADSPWRARDLIIAHVAITDVANRRFRTRERSRRLLDGVAGASTERLELILGDWSATQEDGVIELAAADPSFGLRLRLQPSRPVWLHGESGLSRKDKAGENASYYASIPRLESTGSLWIDGERFDVRGDSWMDHEFFSGDTPAEGLGWDWFSFHLDDGSNLMIYRVRHPVHGEHLFASHMDASGEPRALEIENASFRPLSFWQSDESGNRYPIAWEVRLPREQLLLRTRALLEAQEIDARRSVGFAYWEGLSAAELEWGGNVRRGTGYVELTGYGPSEAP